MTMKIDIIDTMKKPSITYTYESPFKSSSYRVDNNGEITLTIIRPLDLMTYDVGKAKDVSMLRRVVIKIYDTIQGTEYLIREFDAVFKYYLLDERPDMYNVIQREEHIVFNISKIH
jgi:hypothetical protein